MKKLKEKKLLYQIRHDKSADAFAELYDEYVKKVYRFVYFKISDQNEAEDLVSEIFLKAWYYLTGSKAKEVKSFSGLIYRMARNMIVDLYRERAKNREVPHDAIEQMSLLSVSIEESFAVKSEVNEIFVYLKQLKQEYQDIVLLKYMEGLSAPEIAHILDKSKTSVRVTLHRAMKLLREMAERNN
jgi:RNA polymerase sigma-70 factor (ECF subfamily)